MISNLRSNTFMYFRKFHSFETSKNPQPLISLFTPQKTFFFNNFQTATKPSIISNSNRHFSLKNFITHSHRTPFIPQRNFSSNKSKENNNHSKNGENNNHFEIHHPIKFEETLRKTKEYEKDSKEALSFLMDHPIWKKEEIEHIEKIHHKPVGVNDHLAYYSVQILRSAFDFLSGYKRGVLTHRKVFTRVVFLETVAAVPGMVGAMVRHLHSLRLMRRDKGWIHTLLEEAENERLHLLSAIELMKPSYITRLMVLITQGIFVNAWFLIYLIYPKFCHRFVGYLEEEAVKTYTEIVDKINSGPLEDMKQVEAPKIAKTYWKLGENANLLDMFLAIRADENHHREVNHDLAGKSEMSPNPWVRRKINK